MRSNLSVVQRRSEPPDSLDYFPTPPWATRALIHHVLSPAGLYDPGDHIHEPACGEGHMAAVLREFYGHVHASDVFGYGYGDVADYLDEAEKPAVEWMITNPPFNAAEQFVLTALDHPAAKTGFGAAILVRSAWTEGVGRYERLFSRRPPAIIAQFVERVPMHQGRWDPDGKTATSYAWIVWAEGPIAARTPPPVRQYTWIPPGQRKALTKATDFERFAAATPAPLLEG